MTYPKVSTTRRRPAARPASGVPATPRFPEIEERVLAYWDDDGTFLALGRAAATPGRTATTSSSSTTARRSPTACRTTATCSPATSRTSSRATRRCAAAASSAASAGTPTACPPSSRRCASSASRPSDEILELGIETFNDACRESVLKYTDEWREYVTRQARWVDFDHDYKTLDPDYMESVIWAFKQLYDKGLVYEGFRVLPYCWNDQTPLSNHELRMDDDVYQMRQDPAVTVGLRLETGELALGLDDDAVDPAGQPRRSWSAPTSTTSWSSPTSPARPSATSSARPGSRPTPRTSSGPTTTGPGSTSGSSSGSRAATCSAAPSRPPFSYYLGHEHAHRVFPADFVTTEDGTGLVHTAGAFGEEDKIVTDRGGIEPVMPVGPDGRFTCPVTDYEGMQVFDANPHDHRPPQGRDARRGRDRLGHRGHGAAAPRDLRPLLPALLALPRAADLHGGLVLVRRGHQDQGPDARAQPADRLGARAHQGRPVRQVAGERPRLVDLAKPLLGQPDPGLEVATTRSTRASTSTARSRSSSATSASRSTDLHRPFIDDLTRPEPRRPDRAGRRCAGSRTSSTCWFDSGLDVLRPGALPVRERRLVRAPLPGRLHRRVHRPDARLVLHAARPGDGALRPAGVQDLRQPRHRAGLRRPEDVQVAAQLPRRPRGLRPRRRRRDALVPHVQPDPARRQPRRHRAGHPRRRAPGAHPAVEHLVLLLAVRQRRRTAATGYEAKRSTASTDPLDRYLLAKLRRVRRRHDRTSSTTTRSPTRATRRAASSTC